MSNLITLKDILAIGESKNFEFKTSFNDAALESIGSLANTGGGVVLVDVGDTGNLTNLHLGQKTIEDIANKIQSDTNPRIQPSIKIFELDDSKVIIITVEPNHNAPVSVRGKYFKRVGKTNQRMSHNEIMNRILASSNSTWDLSVVHNCKIEDIDITLIESFKYQVKQFGIKSDLNIPIEKLLEKFGLSHNGELTNAAILLFGSDPLKHFPSAYVKIGRFRNPTTIVADREITGTLLQQLDSIMLWFEEHLITEYVITGKPQRTVIWEYPLPAIREAVVNMLCHRDYTNNAHSQIRLYDDRLEFWNAGALPRELTPEALLQEHNSYPRNLKIAKTFFRLGLIENWGSGTTRISKELNNVGLPEPEFKSNYSGFKIIFSKDTDGVSQDISNDLNDT